MKVFVVEDHHLARLAIKAILGVRGYEVQCETLPTIAPPPDTDVLVVDWNLPGYQPDEIAAYIANFNGPAFIHTGSVESVDQTLLPPNAKLICKGEQYENLIRELENLNQSE